MLSHAKVYSKIPLLNSILASYNQPVKLFFAFMSPISVWFKPKSLTGWGTPQVLCCASFSTPLIVATIISFVTHRRNWSTNTLPNTMLNHPSLWLLESSTCWSSSHLWDSAGQYPELQSSGLGPPMWIWICPYTHNSLSLQTRNCYNQEWQRHD